METCASCYALITPEEYSGPDKVPYSYEGKEGRFKGKPFRLGPKVIFEANDPTVVEWTRMLRVLYADGGMFAHGLTYLEFLIGHDAPKGVNGRAAHAAEWALCQTAPMPETQEEMKHVLAKGMVFSVPDAHRQLELSF